MKTVSWWLPFALSISAFSHANEWALSWQQEIAYSKDQLQKNQTLLNVEWNHSLTQSVELTAITRLGWDTQTELYSDQSHPDNYSDWSNPIARSEHGEILLRELYLDSEWFGAYWRLGKQQVVWGQADGLKVLDVVTPQSFQEFILDDFDDSRIPLWMINVEIPINDDSSLQLLWIPDTTYHELAERGSSYEITSPLRVPTPPSHHSISSVSISKIDKPDHWLKDSDFGIRYSSFYNGWDLTANYFYHYRDFAVQYQEIDQQHFSVAAEYERSHLVGITASNAFGDFTFRTEAGWYSDSYQLSTQVSQGTPRQGIKHSEEFSSVIGIDWQGLSDTIISAQWFQSSLLDYHKSIKRDRLEQTLTLLAERHFSNETWTARIQGQYSMNQKDQLWRFKLSHSLLSDVDLWLAADLFSGDDEGLYGQFDEKDRILVGFEWGF